MTLLEFDIEIEYFTLNAIVTTEGSSQSTY